jgi:hypothetical protein|tara:strand:- start:20 stop:523 length:504 start_codon:yes stop_codon:yes gene_type:complete
MNDLHSLKNLIKLLFYIFFGSIFLFLVKGLFAFMENDIRYLGECSDNNSFSNIIFTIFCIKIISKIVFFIGGFYLIKTLNFDDIKEVFSLEKITLFKTSGKLFLISAGIGSITIWFEIFKNGFANLKSNNDFLYALYFSTIIGLFLLIFSIILKKGKELKQENDLTI